MLAICDPEYLRQILIRDFDHFINHPNITLDEKVDPLFGKSLFFLTGQKWRDMRSTLTPIFTGSKMRQMFQLVLDCAEDHTSILLRQANTDSKPFVPELKELFTRYTNDVIATAAFGIKVTKSSVIIFI